MNGKPLTLLRYPPIAQLTWMNPVLQSGQVAGKLICPNEKCGAKIGSFDWAGVQCGCKEWVTPVGYLLNCPFSPTIRYRLGLPTLQAFFMEKICRIV